MPPPQKVRLGDLLIQQGLLTEEQLKIALDEQKRTGRKLGRVFVESGYVTEEGISQALARQLRIPFVDLKNFTPKPDLIKLLLEAPARRFRALVLEQLPDGRLQIGLADPTDLQAYDEITRLVKREIDLAVVTESQLLAMVDRVYHRGEQITGLAKELTAELGDIPIEFGDLLGLNPGAEDAPVVKLLQTVFEEAMRLRASDIHFEPQEKSLRIRFRIDGVLHIQTEADGKVSSAVALRLKLMSGLDISEKRLPQDGRFNIKVRGNPVDVRISTLPTQFGESVVMRLLAQNTGLLELDRIGMPERVLDRLRHALKRPSGMVLVTGPTGSGKTTTLYAALNELNSPEKKVITVEDPVEYRLSGLNQVQVHEKIDLSFSRVLRTVLRQDPDILLIGEMRDQETAEIGMRAAMTGHLVLSTLPFSDIGRRVNRRRRPVSRADHTSLEQTHRRIVTAAIAGPARPALDVDGNAIDDCPARNGKTVAGALEIIGGRPVDTGGCVRIVARCRLRRIAPAFARSGNADAGRRIGGRRSRPRRFRDGQQQAKHQHGRQGSPCPCEAIA